MDLVNRDVKVREELKDAYLKHRRIGDGKSMNGMVEENDVGKYLTVEPDGEERSR